MILDGPNIKSQSGDGVTKQPSAQLSCCSTIAPSVAEWVVLLCVTTKDRETPLPIYVGLTVHARTRKRDLIEMMFDLGLSISYDRVMAISTSMGNRVCEQYHRDEVVCHPIYARAYSQRQRLIISTTIRAPQLRQIPFTVLGYHFSSTPVCKIMGRTAGTQRP
ncbi:hypothetical protein GWK47_036991 [Chionoecetes opilio]|uniref:Uncharacterized protein n=1 Tax=Chionoecetes opilio TaxID=41210 RepID=A0A8J4YE02_CHIOP|nr:hypothetical protein GWK47_036991 [Chionoecetes opilio]